jgi:rhamnose utilization protein RhaD (predicted bifunctional aldolase and dehydrogenase)
MATLEHRRSAEEASLQTLGANSALPQDQWEQRESEGISRLQTINDEIEFHQEKLWDRLERAGIEIPDHHIRTGKRRSLTDAGKHWARVELRRYRDQRIEFWMKLIMPILTFILSVIALVVAIRKH